MLDDDDKGLVVEADRSVLAGDDVEEWYPVDVVTLRYPVETLEIPGNVVPIGLNEALGEVLVCDLSTTK